MDGKALAEKTRDLKATISRLEHDKEDMKARYEEDRARLLRVNEMEICALNERLETDKKNKSLEVAALVSNKESEMKEAILRLEQEKATLTDERNRFVEDATRAEKASIARLQRENEELQKDFEESQAENEKAVFLTIRESRKRKRC